jgi:hypothetical protein
MGEGYFKFWRKALEGGWFRSPLLNSFWLWCLSKAAWSDHYEFVKTQRVKLKRGQFIFTIPMAVFENAASPQRVRTYMALLKNMENLTIESTNKYSIVTILNWDTYQYLENTNNRQSNSPATGKQQASNRPLNKKEGKEGKEIKKPPISPKGDAPSSPLPEFVPVELWVAFVEYRKKIRKPLTPKAQELNLKKLSKMKDQGHDPARILETTIENGWLSFYPPKDNYPKSQPMPKFNDPKEDSKKWMPIDTG